MITEKLKSRGISLPDGFSAGYARKAVNPEEGTGMGGWGNETVRRSTEILDDLCVTCTALCDSEEVHLFFTCDVIGLSAGICQILVDRIGESFGISAEHIALNATHTHTGPGINAPKAPGIEEYRVRFFDAIEAITDEALRDLAPTTARVGKTGADQMNHVRRYVSKKDGSFLGNWPKLQEPDEACHESEADRILQVIRFEREGKKDILMVNWQCHPCSRIAGEKQTQISPDWVSSFRNTVEENMGVHFAYHQGACGNLASGTRILCEKSNNGYKTMGKELAYFAKQALASARPVSLGKLKTCRKELELMRSPVWMQYKGVKKDCETVRISVLSMGEIAFATVPFEWHDSLGRAVRDSSPFTMTFVCGYTGGHQGYLPAAFCWENGGYEVKKCHFPKGTGEMIARLHIELLSKLYEE